MSTEIKEQISNYFGWVESQTGLNLRPPAANAPDHITPARSSACSDVGSLTDPQLEVDRRQEPRGNGRMILLAVAATVALVGGLAAIVSDRPDTPTAPVTQATQPESAGAAPLPGWEGNIAMKVFVHTNATDSQVNAIEEVLADADDVIAEWVYLDAEASLRKAERVLVDKPGAFELLDVDNIPTTFNLVAKPAATDTSLRQLSIRLRKLPAVLATMTPDQAEGQSLLADEPPEPSEITIETTSPPNDDVTLSTPLRLIAVGDQVMLGAADELADAGFLVDAMQSRSFQGVVPVIQTIVREGPVADAVVISAGTNGTILPNDLDAVMSSLASVPRVVVLTVGGDRSWVAENNRLIEALPARFANVVVVDWAAAARECRGNCFYEDGIHIEQDGQDLYVDLIVEAATGANPT